MQDIVTKKKNETNSLCGRREQDEVSWIVDHKFSWWFHLYTIHVGHEKWFIGFACARFVCAKKNTQKPQKDFHSFSYSNATKQFPVILSGWSYFFFVCSKSSLIDSQKHRYWFTGISKFYLLPHHVMNTTTLWFAFVRRMFCWRRRKEKSEANRGKLNS